MFIDIMGDCHVRKMNRINDGGGLACMEKGCRGVLNYGMQ